MGATIIIFLSLQSKKDRHSLCSMATGRLSYSLYKLATLSEKNSSSD